MKWYKQLSDEDNLPFIGELLSRFRSNGYNFWHRLKKLMAEHFDAFNPGCNKFDFKWFMSKFSEIRDTRTVRSYLDFFQEEQKIFYWIEGRHVFLYWPELENLADEYTGKVLVDMVKNEDKNGIPLPTYLHDRCRSHAKKFALQKAEDAKNIIENKQDKSKSVGIYSGVDVGISSVSSSKGVNSIIGNKQYREGTADRFGSKDLHKNIPEGEADG